MPHLIESIAYVGQEPWHGLGKKILEGKKLSIAEAIVRYNQILVTDIIKAYPIESH